jgi:hypothetical protein
MCDQLWFKVALTQDPNPPDVRPLRPITALDNTEKAPLYKIYGEFGTPKASRPTSSTVGPTKTPPIQA